MHQELKIDGAEVVLVDCGVAEHCHRWEFSFPVGGTYSFPYDIDFGFGETKLDDGGAGIALDDVMKDWVGF